MPAVTFQCGSCNNLMAVEEDLRGQQVRCPHCQQVVVAPTATHSASPPMEPAATASLDPTGISRFPIDPSSAPPGSSPLLQEEDILLSPSPISDDLFGGTTQLPAVEMPHDVIGANPAGSAQPDGEVGKPAVSTSEPSADASSSGPATEVLTLAPESPAPLELAPSTADWPATSQGASDLPADMPASDLTSRMARRAKRESLFTTYLIIFLIPYAIFVTCVAAYFYLRMLDMQQRAPHPLEYLRDSGENPPAKRGTSSVLESVSPDTPLPPKLKVALGQQLAIGDLSVQPEKVERRKLVICSENRNVRPQETAQYALVLTLRVRNISQDVYFTPTDPVFDRQWKEEYGASRPFAALEIGEKHFFGGATKWRPRGNRGPFRGDDPREFVKGQERDSEILKPGQERLAIFCTDPSNREILQTLNRHQGALLWRVHLRRGLVDLGDREVSASAVVGVVFDKKEIRDYAASAKQ